MRKTVTAIAAAILVLSLSGCAGSAGPESTSKPTPSPTPTVTTALPAVSLATTCGLLFGSSVDGPAADASDIVTRFVAAPDLSTVTEEELTATIDS